MSETAQQTPRPLRCDRSILLAVIDALKPLGLNATVPEVAEALLPIKTGTRGLRMSARMLHAIVLDARHQSLINTVIMAGCKLSGYDTVYRDLYPSYVRKCQENGIEPVTLKTFQNRALQREARWQRRLAAKSGNQNGNRGGNHKSGA